MQTKKAFTLRTVADSDHWPGRPAYQWPGSHVRRYHDRLPQRAIDETDRRRDMQRQYNQAHNITPTGIVKGVSDALAAIYNADYVTVPIAAEAPATYDLAPEDIPRLIKKPAKR